MTTARQQFTMVSFSGNLYALTGLNCGADGHECYPTTSVDVLYATANSWQNATAAALYDAQFTAATIE